MLAPSSQIWGSLFPELVLVPLCCCGCKAKPKGTPPIQSVETKKNKSTSERLLSVFFCGQLPRPIRSPGLPCKNMPVHAGPEASLKHAISHSETGKMCLHKDVGRPRNEVVLQLWLLSPPEQGSLHCTPEHCLVNGGFPLFWLKKPSYVSNRQNVSFKEPCRNSGVYIHIPPFVG